MRAPLLPQAKLQAAFSITTVAQLGALIVSMWCLAPAPAATADDFDPRSICPNPDTATYDTIGDAQYVVCEPEFGNLGLVVFAHGTVDVTRTELKCTIEAIAGQLDGELNIPRLITGLGFRFAVLSSCDIGLRTIGKQELIELVDEITEDEPAEFVYGAGTSQGGIFVAQGAEQSTQVFDGALAACGPIGNFLKQVNYWGDLLVIVDYFLRDEFGSLVPPIELLVPPPDDGSPPERIVSEPPAPTDWDDLLDRIDAVLADENNADEIRQIRKVARVPTDPDREVADWEAISQVLREAVLGTNEGIESLGGNPYENTNRVYRGSDDELALNRDVKRYAADLGAITTARAFETSGRIAGRVVTLHNKWDPRVPFWHEPLYAFKALLRGSAFRLTVLPVFRFGHCNFNPEEALAAFAILVLQVQGLDLILDAESILPDFQSRARFSEVIEEFGLTR